MSNRIYGFFLRVFHTVVVPRKREAREAEGLPDLSLGFWENVFSNTIREARTENSVSLRELERLTGVTDSEIFKIEAGDQECRLSSFIKICMALGIPPGRAIDDVVSSSLVTYDSAIQADPESVKMLQALGSKDTDKMHFHPLRENLASCCALAAHLSRCSFAQRRAAIVHYPMESMRLQYLEFARRIDRIEDCLERLSISAALRTHPLPELRRQGLLNEDFVKDVIRQTDLALRGIGEKGTTALTRHAAKGPRIWWPLLPSVTVPKK